MGWLRRLALLGCAAVLVAVALNLAGDGPAEARANLACDAAGSIAGGVGLGNPVGDACSAITDPVLGAVGDVALGPIEDAAGSVGEGVFNQITSWATDGAVWLLGEIVGLINTTTTPNLLSKGFVRQYKKMASIAVVLAAMMLIFAAVEGLGRGDPGMLGRVFVVNVPVAALATSAAYVIVQLLVATTDGFCEVIAHSTAGDTREFFKGAIDALSQAGGEAGALAGQDTGNSTAASAGGSVGVPLFVGFIAAMVAAFAAFLVWIELLMRSAAIYAVALFMPLAIAASIWPRWTSALRRSAELVIVVVFSKFVIVAIIALSASLLANTGGEIEHVFSAAALLLLACFAPIVLFRLVPFAEGAVGAAFNRQSGIGAASRTVQTASSVQMMRRAALSNWGGGSKGRQAGGGAGGGGGGSANGAKTGASGAPKGGGGSAGASGGAGAGASAAAAPIAAGVAAAKGSKSAAEQLDGSGTARSVGEGKETTGASGSSGSDRGTQGEAPRPSGSGAGGSKGPRPRSEGEAGASERGSTRAAPSEAKGGGAPGADRKAPRPGGDSGAPPKGGESGKAKP